ncbi:MAG: class I SAM-dependent methyltransferase [Clostridiales Family XIII bacterium]|jgi:SAM-dependent methyltransferase|nr:class I SAM-dependent methyltransferase [Clostridiales Family XIII bacterium]
MDSFLKRALKVTKLGIGNTAKGFIIKRRYRALQREYGFAEWHIAPLEHRRYAVNMSRLIADRLEDGDVVVDIGCGLGDVMRKLYDTASARASYYGFDLDEGAIAAAKHLNAKRDISFACGSFGDVQNHVNGTVDWLFAINFLHCVEKEPAAEFFMQAASANLVRHIVVDVVPYGVEHDFQTVLPSEYRLEYTSEPYEGGRVIQIFTRS